MTSDAAARKLRGRKPEFAVLDRALEVTRTIRTTPEPPRRRPGDLLLDSLAVAHTDGFAAAVPMVNEALGAFRDGGSGADDQSWLWLASVTAPVVWDEETWSILTARRARLAREVGDLSVLPLVLNALSVVHLLAGEYPAAASLVAETEAINEATGVALASYARLTLVSWHGDQATAMPLIEASLADATARGEDIGALATHWAHALLLNGLGRYQDAIAAARAAADHPVENAIVYWALCELIEAAVRSGRPAAAAAAYERLALVTRASGTEWALGVLAPSGALLAPGDTADELYREAIERLGRTRIRTELARAHLLYGEWLRRENRRQEARGQLRTAYDMFTAAAGGAFADRARRELAATGESTADRAVRAHDTLTPQEANIAGLAGSGLTNVEIGARLFLSPHTVEWHLRKVFTKLGITSRRQLRPPGAG